MKLGARLLLIGGFCVGFAAAAADPRNGEYLFRVAGCIHCHTESGGERLAGGRTLVTPFGIFYSPNITPDLESGIGRWTEANFKRAIRDGVSPSGVLYYPVFPYPSYSQMTDADIRDIFSYIRTLPPVRKNNRPHEINFPYNQRWLNRIWQWLFLYRGPFQADRSLSETVNRGAYVAQALAHCGECHTPKNSFGAPIFSKWMAGSRDLFLDRTVPNITPDIESGLGKWTLEDWDLFLLSGFTPEKRSVGGEMAWVIEGVANLSDQDRLALISYMSSLKPMQNYLERSK